MILARFRPAEGTVWYLADKLDTVRDVANAFGTPIAHVDLDTFGGVAALADPELVGRYLFTGREFDSETSLYYYRARFYDPSLGRFLSEDPLGFDAGDVNLSRYVSNSPTNATDPLGLTETFEYVGVAVIGVIDVFILAKAFCEAMLGYEVIYNNFRGCIR